MRCDERRGSRLRAREALWVGAIAAWASGCSPGLMRGGGPVPEVERDGVVYWAETRFLTVEPVRIQTIVGATNRRNRAVEVRAIACPVFVRLYGEPARVGVPAWDEEPAYERWQGARGRAARGSEGECRHAGDPVLIQPGESTWLTVSVVEPQGLGDTIPPGRYHFTAVVPVGGRRLELMSGEAELGGAPAGAPEGLSGGARTESNEGR